MSKASLFRGKFNKSHGKEFKHCSKLSDSTVTIFIDPCGEKLGCEIRSE